ncbi:MAG: hypothetical protein WAL32_18460, partial [Terriglobales bacterium]
LLATSGLILAALMVTGFWVWGDRAKPEGVGAFLEILALVLFAGGLTAVSNLVLRKGKRP